MESQSQKPSSGNEPGKLSLQGLNTAAYLKAEPLLAAEHKAALATHLAAAFNAPGDDPGDVAEAILRVIIWNNEGKVVETIAQAAASNPNMTNSMAWALANDDESAAMPILKSSLALSDTDLVSIVESSENFEKMGAIASRSSVSADLSRSLARHGDETTAQLLLNNANADIPEDALTCILDRHEQNQYIVNDLAGRDTLSFALTERLLDKVSPELANDLRARHSASTPPSTETALPRIDRNIMGYRDERSPEELDDQVSQMIARNEITAALLMEKVCLGYFEFFISAIASMSKRPKDDVRSGLLESPAKSLPEVWKAASLAVDWLPVASAALTAFLFVQKNYSKSDIPAFRRNISDRAVASLKNEKRKLSDEQERFFRSL